jgi:drug/metabolite transporter (DMT)-like permease
MKRSIHLSPSDHSLIRYLVSFVVMAIICKYNDLKILGPRSELKLLSLRGLFGSLNVFAVYFSIMFLNPSDATTLVHVSIIITSIISRFFLGEKLTLAHLVAIVLTANGVLFISKPSFLFGPKPLPQRWVIE